LAATLPIAPAVPAAARPRVRSLTRVAGFAGLAFVALVAAENLIVGATAPPANDASAAEIADYVAAHKTAISVAVGMVPFAAVALYVFIASATARLRRASEQAAAWTRLGMSGLLAVGPLFLTGLVFQYVLLARSADLAADAALTETLWQLHGAAFIPTGIALAVGMIGLSRAARLNGLIPTWHQGLGFIAAGAFLIASAAAVPAVEGSPVGLLGFAAFVGWLVWLALTSVRLLRAPEASA
jgi:hypothetical protein